MVASGLEPLDPTHMFRSVAGHDTHRRSTAVRVASGLALVSPRQPRQSHPDRGARPSTGLDKALTGLTDKPRPTPTEPPRRSASTGTAPPGDTHHTAPARSPLPGPLRCVETAPWAASTGNYLACALGSGRRAGGCRAPCVNPYRYPCAALQRRHAVPTPF